MAVDSVTVRTIYGQSNKDDNQINALSQIACRFVDSYVSGLPTDIMEDIYVYITCHYMSASEGVGSVTSDSIGGVIANTYGVKYGSGLSATSFGQTAMMLDTTGALARLDKYGPNPTKAKAVFI